MISSKISKLITLGILTSNLVFTPIVYADSINDKISQIEKSHFGYTYTGSNESRLVRLEKALYGKTNTGAQKNRIDKLYKDLNLDVETITGSATPINQPQDIGPKADAGIKYPVVDKLEQKVFNKIYQSDDIYNRLSRLEKDIFKKESTLSLNERVDALRGRILGGSSIATTEINPYTEEIILENGQKYYGDGFNPESSNYNYYSYENSKNRIQKAKPQNDYESTNLSPTYGQNYDLDILEKQLFGKRFTEESHSQRLARLENKVFERTFSDDEEARVQRLLAVTTAQKTSSEYDSNKWSQRLNAGMQIGSILLMVLAMIL